MELRQLQYFVAVAEELHFGRAAERLHIVQPGVSQQIRRLERSLGVALLDRSTRRVELTEAGRRFLPRARYVLAAVQDARESVAAFGPQQPHTLRIGTSAGLGDRLPRLLAELDRRQPGLAVELVRLPAQARLSQVASGDLDAAFVRDDTHHAGLRLEPVWSEELLAALPSAHPLADQETVAVAQLARMPVRLPARHLNARLVDAVVAACRTAGFEPNLAPATNDQDMLAMITAGTPTWTVYYSSEAAVLAQHVNGVSFRLLTDPAISMPTALALRQGRSQQSLMALLAASRVVG
ncbi:MAG TPA: LysR substrate-binding domain-containing protein [Streptosporangiaceae bacterium]|nr:LysR substrate-binding domain-containing protein [Streptosporangiaceae bacterium]